uniref:Tyrosine-protein phosphatase non-receptor type 20 n=1 Tax=Bos mutus grunniens TaxID=30521 RepID=A0A8B9X1L9_BOSMU
MSSPENATAASGEDQRGKDSDMKNLNLMMTLHSSSQETTPRPVNHKVFQNEVNSRKLKVFLRDFQHSDDFEDQFKDEAESENDGTLRKTSSFFLKQKSSSEDEELAGPSHPALQGMEIVSEKELAQLALVRPLIFNTQEESTIRDYFKILTKKVSEDEITQEFKALEVKNLPAVFHSGNELHNRDKNRYRDILPYDSTRVPLGENKDYINASYIKIANSREEYYYIATQGPLPTTTNDFWQMVWENNSNVIAMITKEKEGGVTKCHHYWPISMKKPLELNSCHIFLENYQILRYFIIRMFQVVKKSTGASHFVKHLQFTNWPDHGTPASAEGFIKYVHYVRKSHLTGPVVVHCSAGVGRTGVFLCVDVVFCAIEKNFSFDIMNIVSQMREQRHGMVQTKEQYMFCYKIVLEVLQKLWTVK